MKNRSYIFQYKKKKKIRNEHRNESGRVRIFFMLSSVFPFFFHSLLFLSDMLLASPFPLSLHAHTQLRSSPLPPPHPLSSTGP
jgi:hypothetical protein